MMTTGLKLVGAVLLLISLATAQAQKKGDATAKPAVAGHTAEHVVILSLDGLRAVNLANFVSSHPQSALAELSRRGITYTNAHVAWPDTTGGLATLVSGGSPVSTGILASAGYSRPGPESESESDKPCGLPAGAFDLLHQEAAPDKCAAIQPHALLRVNTVFDLVHAAHGGTAWADAEGARTDLLRGRSGQALDKVFLAPSSYPGKDRLATAAAQDEACLDEVLRWVERGPGTPRLFGLSLVELDAAQRSLPLSQTAAEGAASSVKRSPLEHIDALVQKLVDALKKAKLFDSTWVVVTAPHGAMGDLANMRVVDAAEVEQVARAAAPQALGRVVVATDGMIWLTRPEKTDAVVKAYRARMLALGIGAIYFGEKLRLVMNTASEDNRMPDVILEPQAGVVWSNRGQWPEHFGGFNDDENHVALLISGRQFPGSVEKAPVSTGQVAPSILQLLHMDAARLEALHQESVTTLPKLPGKTVAK